MSRALQRVFLSVQLAALVTVLTPATDAAGSSWDVIRVNGDTLDCLMGTPSTHFTVFACSDSCGAIPWQFDERDVHGSYALPEGPEPSHDESPGIVDDNDEFLAMAADSGRIARSGEIPASTCALEVKLTDPQAGGTRWLYVLALVHPGELSPVRYVRFDRDRDIILGERVALGFGGPTPRFLGLVDKQGNLGANLLDRLKIRVSTRFLGIVPVSRDDGDLEPEVLAWKSGPIRVLRRQAVRAYVGFGIRSHRFVSETAVYRDYAEIPVGFRLNYKPTHFFWPIRVEAYLDFRDLSGWFVSSPAVGSRKSLISKPTELHSDRSGTWFAIENEEATLVNTLTVSPSLDSVQRRSTYRFDTEARTPEDLPGERPAIGYELTDWNEVPAGHHSFTATSYALPPGSDVGTFLRERSRTMKVEVKTLAP